MCIRKLILALACALPFAAAQACGPDFPQQLVGDRKASLLQLPEGMFFFEAGRLLPKPADKLRAVETSPLYDADESTPKPDPYGLSGDEQAKVKAMRAAADMDAATRVGAGLAPEVRDYTLGAIAFKKGESAAAAAHFRAVLALSPPQRARLGMAAQYSLARTLLADGDTDGASAAYAVVREWALSGIPDPQGLAVASLGEQGRIAWHHGAVAAAVKFYAQQAAHDSSSGAASLLFVARSLLAHRDQLDQALDDPLSQRLLAAYLYTRSNEFGADWPLAGSQHDDDPASADSTATTAPATPAKPASLDAAGFLKAVQAHGLATFDGADRLAAGAYNAGRYDLAGQLAAKSDTALAAWVRAKLALRAGDQATAATEYAKAAKGFPADENWAGQGDYAEYAPLQRPLCRVQTERGILALARADYVEAMARMYAGASEYWPDAAYVAERVLTVDELKKFVDANVPAVARAPAKSGDDSTRTTPGEQLRGLLARRLVRVGRVAEALPYFADPAVRKQAQALLDAHQDDHAWSSLARANALFAQARIVRQHGMELMGAELEPDNAQWGGSFEADALPSLKDKELVGGDEGARVTASAITPDARYHYRYLASNLAEQAAALVPARSQAYAAMMCSATGWMLDTDAASAQRIYHRYLRNGAYVAWGTRFGRSCPVPDFDTARWVPWKMRYHAARLWAHRQWPWLLGGLVVLIGLALGWRLRGRKTV